MVLTVLTQTQKKENHTLHTHCGSGRSPRPGGRNPRSQASPSPPSVELQAGGADPPYSAFLLVCWETKHHKIQNKHSNTPGEGYGHLPYGNKSHVLFIPIFILKITFCVILFIDSRLLYYLDSASVLKRLYCAVNMLTHQVLNESPHQSSLSESGVCMCVRARLHIYLFFSFSWTNLKIYCISFSDIFCQCPLPHC